MADSPRAIFERYLQALQGRDFATLRAVAHPGFEDFYPQSGEVTRGIDNLIAILLNYPGQLQSLGRDRVVGGETRFVSAPNFTVLRVEGGGEHFTGLQRATKDCQKGEYDKGQHSFQILARIDPAKVRMASSIHAERFLQVLDRVCTPR